MNSMTFERALSEFKDDFNSIKNIRFKTNRKGNTGIGKTFEDLIGVVENNNLPVDYKGFIELKSQRDYTGSKLSLFTKSPNPYGINAILRECYGEIDPKLGLTHIFHTAIKHSAYNSYKSRVGFKLFLNRNANRLEILGRDLLTGNKLTDHGIDAYWNLDDLRDIVESKCRNIAYISGKSEIINGEEYFTFNKAILLSGLTFENFVNYIEQDIIIIEFRIGTFPNGSPHDRGTAFRIQKRNIPLVFNHEIL